jgi:3-deoxy-D-manno-octulosonic-acid transferase
MSIGYFLYKISTQSYFKLIQLIAPFHERAGKLYRGQLNPILIDPKATNQKRLWLHVASLGEFEQAKPVLIALKNHLPQLQIVVSFFSPSGYENRKNDGIIDYAMYLPFESRKNVQIVIDNINPDWVIWVKYDFWIDYLNEIYNRKIPLYLIAALFNPNQYYFKFPGNFHLKIFKQFTQIFTQNIKSSTLLANFKIKSVIAGDPRFDNVNQLKSSQQDLSILDSFWNNSPLIVCGSTYRKEEKAIACVQKSIKLEFKYIIAPHFVDEKHVNEIAMLFPHALRYSAIKKGQDLSTIQTIIIDNIGLLAQLYRKATIAIVGGGFKKGGLHNILEATIHGIPVLFGPQINRFPEALELVANKSAYVFQDAQSLLKQIEHIYPNRISMISENASIFMNKHLGSGEAIAKAILADIKH